MKVVFVCTGNICRSPMAEYMLRDKVASRPVDLEIGSAGVAATRGRPPSPPAVQVLKRRGIDEVALHRARPVSDLTVSRGDLLLTMTRSHRAQLPPSVEEAGAEVHLLKEYVGQGGSISDPYGAGVDVYEQLYRELDPLLETLAEDLVEGA